MLFARAVNRREFLRTGAAATALLLTTPSWQARAAERRPADEEVLAQAKERIEKHRKVDGQILVRNRKGKPVRGVRVTIDQVRQDFLFGCNLFQFGRCRDQDQEDLYRQRFAQVFNYCTLGFYWAAYEPQRGRPAYAYTDQVLEWTRAHDIRCKGHPLVWDHPAGSPRWLPDNPAEIAQLSNARVREIVTRYKDAIGIWDVVNEATHLPQEVNHTAMARWGKSLGPATYVAEPLKIARAANPSALLLVNDYRTDPPYRTLLEEVRMKGNALFDVVGIQSHMHDGMWPLAKVWEVCETYRHLSLPLHFTETTLLSGSRKGPGENWGQSTAEMEAKQADQTAAFYTTLFSHPAVQAITWWDFSDYHAWQRAPAGWLREDMSPKPVYQRLRDMIRSEWWTKAQGVTNRDGLLNVRAFSGSHNVTVDVRPSKAVNLALAQTVHWQAGQPNQVEFRI
jgi:endo-1,4-beta-xylanase